VVEEHRKERCIAVVVATSSRRACESGNWNVSWSSGLTAALDGGGL